MNTQEPDAYIVRTVKRGNLGWTTGYGRFLRLNQALSNAAAISRLIPANYTVTVTPQRRYDSVTGGDFWDDLGEPTHHADGRLPEAQP